VAEQIRIGFIGAGGIARHHVKQLKEIPEAKIVAMADPSEASLKKMVEAHPEMAACATYSDYRQMLDKEKLDAVEIHTPHTQHFGQAMDALGRGLHALIEKPMVVSTDHAKQLIAAKKDRVVVVSYQRHYQPMYLFVKQKIDEGALGPLQYIAALQSQGWYQGCKGTWRHDPALSGGGQLTDSGSHLMDIMLWTTGLEPAEVYATQEYYDTKVDIDSAITVRFKNGAMGTISIIGHSPMWWEDFSIWGPKAAILYRNGTLYYQEAGAKMVEPENLPEGSNPDRNFIAAMLGRETVKSTPEGFLKVIGLTEAAWRSAREGKPIKI
jgi:predicted dehydrogenase